MIKEPELWELISLELDRPAEEIGKYFEKELGKKIRRYKKEERDNSKATICNIINEALGESLKRKLVVYGSGYYHHFTYGLCKHVDKISKDYAYIHFDHHTDIGCSNLATVSCGSFVQSILGDANASAALFIGNDAPNERKDLRLLGIREEQLRKKKGFRKLRKKLLKLPGEAYLSFDLDVMLKSLIATNFGQGTTTTEELMKCVSLIKETKHIIGADILGYRGEGNDPGKELYAKIVESLLEA